MEEGMYEEMRAQEAIRRIIVMYVVKELDQSVTGGKERLEMDREEHKKIFIAAGWKEGQNRRKGGRTKTCHIWNEIRNNQMRDFGPGKTGQEQSTKGHRKLGQTRPDPEQNQAEMRLATVVEKKNKEEMIKQDKANRLRQDREEKREL